MAHILVIDDDHAICSFISKILCHLGYEVKVAHNGEEGIELFKKYDYFQMVITDIRMPRKDGNSVAKYIRSSAKSYDTPVLAITGFLNDVQRDLFDIVLEKPFKTKDLINVINFFQ